MILSFSESRASFSRKANMSDVPRRCFGPPAGFLQKNRAAMVDFMSDVLRARRFYLDPTNHDEVVGIVSRPPSSRRTFSRTGCSPKRTIIATGWTTKSASDAI
jgi:hypothetical protein